MVYEFKGILENKKTDSIVWKDKDQAWEKITRLFNSKRQNILEQKNRYENFMIMCCKRQARNIQDWGGVRERNNNDTTRDLLLDNVNSKGIFGLNTQFGGDAQEAINIEVHNAGKAINKELNENAEVIDDHATTEEHCYVLKEPCQESCIEDNNKNTGCIIDNGREHRRGLSQELRHNWTNRRRPKIQQLHSSKLAEEYSELAQIKSDIKREKKSYKKRMSRRRIIQITEKEA
nr:unnamed protein product [Callosobruchus analis]